MVPGASSSYSSDELALRCGEFGIVIMNDFALMNGGESGAGSSVENQNDSGECSLDFFRS